MYLNKLKIAFLLAVLTFGIPKTQAAINLGVAGPANWTVLTLGGNIDVSNVNGLIVGNVGMTTPGAALTISGSADVFGKVYLEHNGTVSVSGGSTTGTIYGGLSGTGGNYSQDVYLTSVKTAALNASTTFAGMASTMTVPGNAITGSAAQTIHGGAGVNVLNLSALTISGCALTFDAPAGATFIVNITGSFTLSAGADILISGGLTPFDIVYNTIGTGTTVNWGGGHNPNHPEITPPIVNGIVLAPQRDLNFAPGNIVGEAIGNSLNLYSGSYIKGFTPVPEASTVYASGIVMVVAGLTVFKRQRSKE